MSAAKDLFERLQRQRAGASPSVAEPPAPKAHDWRAIHGSTVTGPNGAVHQIEVFQCAACGLVRVDLHVGDRRPPQGYPRLFLRGERVAEDGACST